jgi:hypothetical protein
LKNLASVPALARKVAAVYHFAAPLEACLRLFLVAAMESFGMRLVALPGFHAAIPSMFSKTALASSWFT